MLVPGAIGGVVREVVLADAGSTDATLEVAEAAGAAVLTSAAPLGGRLKDRRRRRRARRG